MSILDQYIKSYTDQLCTEYYDTNELIATLDNKKYCKLRFWFSEWLKLKGPLYPVHNISVFGFIWFT